MESFVLIGIVVFVFVAVLLVAGWMNKRNDSKQKVAYKKRQSKRRR